jgi:hypothetical protein
VNGSRDAASNHDSNADLGAQAWWMQLVANAREHDSRTPHTGECVSAICVLYCTA